MNIKERISKYYLYSIITSFFFKHKIKFKICRSFLAGAILTMIFLDGTNFPGIFYFLLPLTGGLGALGVGRFYLKSYFEKQKSQFRQIVSAIAKCLKPDDSPVIRMEESRITDEEAASGTAGTRRERS